MDERQEKTKIVQDQQTVTTTSRVLEQNIKWRYIIFRFFFNLLYYIQALRLR